MFIGFTGCSSVLAGLLVLLYSLSYKCRSNSVLRIDLSLQPSSYSVFPRSSEKTADWY